MSTQHRSQHNNVQHTDTLSLEDMHHDVLLQIEAILFASDHPISLAKLKEAFNNQYNKQQLRVFLQQLAMLQHGRAIELIETAQGFRFQVRAKYRNMITQVWPERPVKLSPSLLETVAVIAYHQPVTRADIEQIRGVSNNSQILRTLFDWSWIKESGFRDVPGKPALLVTTPQFLNAFGLSSLGQLPPLQDAKEAFMTLDSNIVQS